MQKYTCFMSNLNGCTL
uniref:Uncharacterized protein n=1 Tax=Anguilla anguilla TaxID=7936 RepID=A0A0E9VVD0_ANGAN